MSNRQITVAASVLLAGSAVKLSITNRSTVHDAAVNHFVIRDVFLSPPPWRRLRGRDNFFVADEEMADQRALRLRIANNELQSLTHSLHLPNRHFSAEASSELICGGGLVVLFRR